MADSVVHDSQLQDSILGEHVVTKGYVGNLNIGDDHPGDRMTRSYRMLFRQPLTPRRPIAVHWQGKRLEVRQVLHSWHTPNGAGF